MAIPVEIAKLYWLRELKGRLLSNMRRMLSFGGSALSRALSKLKFSQLVGRITSPPDEREFIFLCGANKPDGSVSARREEIIKFTRDNYSHLQVFVAEKVFEDLERGKTNPNILDLENIISGLSDKIIIILESNSAFCELGAFARKTLRSKVFVINDSKYEKSKSFVNMGPIKAIREINTQQIMHYPMKDNGVESLDGIGEIFASLDEVFTVKERKYAKRIPISDCDPSVHFTKESVKYIHDLVFLLGPITHKEIVRCLQHLFGTKDFTYIKEIMGFLRAVEFISICEYKDGNFNVYKSNRLSTILNYDYDLDLLIAAFRRFHFKNSPKRLSL